MAKKKQQTRPTEKSPEWKKAEQAEMQAEQQRRAEVPTAACWMGALCYLSVLILIPACSRRRHDPFVAFHLNQGLVLLALGTVCGALAMVPGFGEVGLWLTILVDAISLAGLVGALRRRKTALPGVAQITHSFHPFD